MRFLALIFAVVLALCALGLSLVGSAGWLFAFVPLALLAAVGIYDLVQRRHAILRNYPLLGHLRFFFETLRPEIQQYFIESNTDGRPYAREDRSVIYERAKLDNQEVAFGTQLDVFAEGYEWMTHSLAAKSPPDAEQPRVTIGGQQCDKPYEMALLNVSAMSFGSLSGNAIRALNLGAKRGGFAHDTGEGGLSDYHLQGGDLVWEIGSGYFGCRTDNGGFDADEFQRKATREEVKTINIKLSQGAKPGRGGVMPGKKVTQEIADVRGVPKGEKCESPPSHSEFHTPTGLLEFVQRLRELSGGKPTGFKLCVGSRIELLSIAKAILATGIEPDFIIVDGAEGGTGAAPIEFSDHVGMPLREGLISVRNTLVGTGLRNRIKIGASGKVSTGFDMARLCAIGADYTNAARAMMMSIGCIQSRECHLNTCPVGVATQDPSRARALIVERSAERCCNFQHETIQSLRTLIASQGLDHPSQLQPDHIVRRISETESRSYAELYEWLGEGELLADPREAGRRTGSWRALIGSARRLRPDHCHQRFAIRSSSRRVCPFECCHRRESRAQEIDQDRACIRGRRGLVRLPARWDVGRQAPKVGISGNSISSYKFKPATVHIKEGKTVRWNWRSNASHNVTFKKLNEHSKTTKDGSFSLKFAHKGTYHYICTIHDFKGKVVVR